MEIPNNVNTAEYGVNQIKTLEGIEAIRLRAGMYIGSVGPEGVRHITLEIISNAVDEYLNGHCTLCRVGVLEDGTIIVRDNGRGVPFGKAEDGSETLVNVYTKLHTGAKFDSNGKTGYNTSGGYARMLRFRSGIAAKLRLDARSQNIQVIGLCDVVIAAAAKAHDHIIIFIARSQENNRCLCLLAQDFAEIHAVAVRQHHIEQNKIRRAFLQQKCRLLNGIRTMYGITLFFQKVLIDPHDIGIILYKQNMCHSNLRDYKIVILFDFR